MRTIGWLVAGATLAFAQGDPAYAPLAKAYEHLRAKQYDDAIARFRDAIAAAPARAAIRKDLAYALLKVGETEAARDQFAEASRLDPTDHHVALEYAFLCFETRERQEARRVFDRIRKSGDPASRATAETAFENIDRPLAEGIARWTEAIAREPENFSAHRELAALAEQRDDPALAARHYERAFRLKPDQRSLLLDLGRVWREMKLDEQSHAALLAASRGAEPRVAETARGLLPERYPYVYEFRRALELDPANTGLRRELAFLLLSMDQKQEAETELKRIADQSPDDYMASAQLGFLLKARGEAAASRVYLERALASDDEDLAARVRESLGMPEALRRRTPGAPAPPDDTLRMADRSYAAGYMKDALRYYASAHEADPTDFGVILKLGWTHNMLRQDDRAIRWFDLARRSPDPKVAAEAARAYGNLKPQFTRFRATAWMLPVFSSRWKDMFSYGQIRGEVRVANLPLRPYLSLRFAGDVRGATGGVQPQYLSESAFIAGAGVATRAWRRLTAWGEAGSSIRYARREGDGRAGPDYRGGVSYGRGFGRLLGAESGGAFAETHEDAVFLSRFENDLLLYSQNRFGYTLAPMGALRAQVCWNANITTDARRLYWANFAETGPGVRFRWESMPAGMFVAADVLRGAHMVNEGNPRRPNYFDVRVGIWYAWSR